MLNLKLNGNLYPADFAGKMNDIEWDRRESKTIIFAPGLTVAQVEQLLGDDVAWSIYDDVEDIEYDNSEFRVLGDITLHPTGEISVKMGKPTDLEEAYELLYGGNE